MSTQAPTFEQSVALHGELQKREFFHKLAELGVRPETEEERESLLEIGSRMLQKGAAQQPKPSGESLITKAARGLRGVVDPDAELRKRAAAYIQADPTLLTTANVIQRSAVQSAG